MKRLLFLLCLLFTTSIYAADLTLTEGEGIDLTESAPNLTVSGEDASTSNKGLASFDTNDFTVSSGAVSLKTASVSLTADVSGTLPVTNGGTGVITLTDGGVLLGNAGGAIVAMDVLAAGTIILGDGTTDPTTLAAFTSNLLKHEYGGVEADVSAYSGILAITGGATYSLDTTAELATAITGETGSGAVVFGTSPTITGAVLDVSNNTNIAGARHHLRFTIIDPATAYGKSATICIVPTLDAAITVTNLEVTCGADPTTELTGDIMYADTFIGKATPVVINDFDTAIGVRSDSSITSGAVASGKAIYVSFDTVPETAITQVSFDLSFDYN
jgi:hypothetical protein